MATFETPFDPACFRFENFSVVISEDANGITPPTRILQHDQDFYITVNWENQGTCTGMIAGEWHLLLFAESIGPGDEKIHFDPDAHIFDLNPGPAPTYSRTIRVPAGTLGVAGDHGVSLYRLIVSLTYFDASGVRMRGPISVFEDAITIQIYEEGVTP
ncbi:MAG: hypothetical protein DHS20C20_23520 [Ardenticatenaceae bacterium]|nr:MAG: hypothetical protein DHS20C20_23520 [Ardenticatenaceae bacterium]